MFVSSPTELTTGITDAVLAVECVLVAAVLWRAGAERRWRAGLWCWTLGLLAASSMLGAVAHSFQMTDSTRDALWIPLYLSLGILVGLFLVGAVHDWLGQAAARRLVPWAIGAGAALLGATLLLNGAFVVFVVYEAGAMLGALVIFARLAMAGRLQGAPLISAAVVLNLAAAGVQASSASLRLVVPLDHNGLFHLIQMVAIAVLGMGLRAGMSDSIPTTLRSPRAIVAPAP
jgi:hypothetical protein